MLGLFLRRSSGGAAIPRLSQITTLVCLKARNVRQLSILSNLRIQHQQQVRAPVTLGGGIQVRWNTRGQEYQPSSLKRKRQMGYLARMRTKGGRKVLERRIRKGRKYLSC